MLTKSLPTFPIPPLEGPGLYGYPPDKQEKATKAVLEQAEVLSEEWASA
jgi:hypothetical protein